MLRLKNVSKFYYNKGVIAAGFSKVNVEFNLGEFVAIVGESGSGKSTLLNVISGLDSYEEGEMYINGLETSHYRECDFEEYRKKYVSNIFQNFNLVNSYTVYQNVELVLLLNGYKKNEVKKKVLEIIGKVRLSKYKNTKVSKLSGGQKQRVAIARALAKETPIIICDEPTGNLDSKAAREVIKLLSEIAKDKLVIVVTHNFSEIENVATRVIRMHDGKMVSDKKINEIEICNKEIINDNKSIGIFNIIRLGIRNTFNIVPKFLLIFAVFLFITVSLLTVYGSLKRSEYESSKLGYNWYFSDTSDTRIVIKKSDGSSISSSDIDKLNKIKNISYVVENDIILDSGLWFETIDDSYLNFYGILKDIDTFDDIVDVGRMPKNNNEVLVTVDKYDYYFTEMIDEMLDSTYYLEADENNMSVKVVGVKYLDTSIFGYVEPSIYVTSELMDEYMIMINKNYSNGKIIINNNNYQLVNEKGYSFNIEPSDKVSEGYAYVSENINYTCKDYDCKNKNIGISIENLYYTDKIDLKIGKVYNDKNINSLLGIDKNSYVNGSIFISQKDYDKLFDKESYQSSVFASRVDYVDEIENELNEMGYDTLQIRKTLNQEGGDISKVIKIVKLVVIVGLVITLFFISYFVIKLILKSRQIYFSTLRILGGSLGHVKKILDVELFVNSTLAYVLFVGFILLVKNDILEVSFIKNMSEYLLLRDYILMYIILVLMSYLISSRFSSKVFKKSAMKTYREEV